LIAAAADACEDRTEAMLPIGPPLWIPHAERIWRSDRLGPENL
jgi:hypothetical protein